MKNNVSLPFIVMLLLAMIGFSSTGFPQTMTPKSEQFVVEGKGKNHEKEVFDRVEENPRPESGDNGWYAYLAKTIKYSKRDRDAKIEGTVIVGFEVRADGSIHHVEILRGIGGECDQEALRVVTAGPNWQPGKIGGEAVNTRMSMPIQFKLSGSGSADSSRETAIKNLYGQESVVVIGYLPQASR